MDNTPESTVNPLEFEFESRKILLIGETIIDEQVECSPLGLSLETPTIVGKLKSTRQTHGGAGLVARNLANLGMDVRFVTMGRKGRPDFPSYVKYLLQDPTRNTPKKTSFWVDGYKLFKLDDVDNSDISPALQSDLLEFIDHELHVNPPDAVVVADYRHGMLPTIVGNNIVAMADANSVPLYVASQMSHRESNHLDYQGATAFCLNKKEATAVSRGIDPYQALMQLNAEHVVVTLGEDGCVYSSKAEKRKTHELEATPLPVLDTCGAGDAFLAAWVAFGSFGPEAYKFANIWAALACTLKGSEPPTMDMLNGLLKNATEADLVPYGPNNEYLGL